MATAIRDGQIQEIDDGEIDVKLPGANSFFSTQVNMIPMQSAVQAPRLFYGARFFNQAVPLAAPQAPLVQALTDDPNDESFDDITGAQMGAVRSNLSGVIKKLDADHLVVRGDDGVEETYELYNQFPFNRKSSIHNTAVVNKGDRVEAGQLLARSNYTDENGVTAMGRNARVGVVPYKGYSMDDAIVVSESFAKGLTSRQTYTDYQEFDSDVKGGLGHFTSLFPTKYKKSQLENMDENGVAKIGTVLQEGDPYVLATKPRMFTSTAGQLGKLTRAMQHARQDSSMVWHHSDPAEVIDVVKTRKGYKVILDTRTPAKMGDKMVFRPGSKHIISKILPDDKMPRTEDGKPLDVMLNPLSIPSRVNSNIIYELLLGKVAEKQGAPIKVKGFNEAGDKWYEYVLGKLEEAGLSDVEKVYDPETDKMLERPITVGNAHVLKLHHMAEGKMSSRGQGSYDVDLQPMKGGSDNAQAKRLSTLELHSLASAGAYANMREGSTLRGQQNDEYWRALRQGQKPREPGSPFVWDKFQHLLMGAGLHAKDVGGGRLRMGPMTDKVLDGYKPVELKNGEMLDLNTMEPIAGGLFDPSLVGSNKWGYVDLDQPMPNPAFEDQIAQLLGITRKNFRRVMDGDMTLEEAQA